MTPVTSASPGPADSVLTRAAALPDAVVRYAAHQDGVIDLHLPDGPGPHPLVVTIHGGFWKQRYDRTHQRIVRWDMTALGDYTGRWFAGNKGWIEATSAAPLPLGFVFELDQTAYELPPERRRPRSFMHAYMFRAREEHYWDPDKWLEDWKKRQRK